MTVIPVGRYCCVQTKSRVLGPVIRASTHSKFDHALVAGPDGQIAQATPAGVRLGLLSEYAGRPACANLDELMSPAQGMQVWDAAVAMVDAPYDWPDLLALAAADLGWHWNLVFRLLNAGPWRICSQLVCLAGKAGGMSWDCNDRWSDQVTPAALARRPGVVPVTIGA